MQVLAAVSRCGAATSVCVDRAAGAALVHFEQAAAAGAAVRELRRLAAHLSAAEPDQPRLCVDYASRECQVTFPHKWQIILFMSTKNISNIIKCFLCDDNYSRR